MLAAFADIAEMVAQFCANGMQPDIKTRQALQDCHEDFDPPREVRAMVSTHTETYMHIYI